MRKKLSKFGNSTALIIDKAILKLLNLESDSEVEIKIIYDGLFILPVKKSKAKTISKSKETQEAYETVIERYAEALKKLAR